MKHIGIRNMAGSTIRSNLLLTVCMIGFSALGLNSQSSEPASDYVFPRFVLSEKTDSGIALFNPTSDDASVLLSLRGSDGQPVGSPATIAVPPRGQVSRTASQVFGTTADLNASLQVSSETAGIVSYYQTFDTKGSFMDGADAPASGLSLIFPVILETDPEHTEITLLNDTARNTLVLLRLWKTDGSMIGQSTVQITAKQRLQQSLRSLFPAVSDFSGASHITTESRSPSFVFEPQPVSGTSFFANNSSDIAALNALVLTQTSNSGAIPYFNTGAGHYSTLSIANIEPAPIDVSITAVGSNGSSLGTRQVRLSGNGGFREPIESTLSLPSGASGWILLQSTGRIAATLLHGRGDTGAFSAVPSQKAPQTRFIFAQAIQGFGYFTQVSLANPGPDTAFTNLYVIDPDGTTLASIQIVLPPGASTTRTLEQWMPELTDLAGGVLFVETTATLFGTSAVWTDSASTVADFLPQPVPAAYAPAPLKVFAVSGNVTLNGGPAKNFSVVLSGPAGSVTSTRDDGSYVFAGLPAGRYSMTIDQFGFQFIPGEVNFEITTASKRQDFQGVTAESGIVVQPASIPAGSPDVTIAVYGRNLNPTSTAFVGPVRLQTSYMEPMLVHAILPAYLLESAGRFDLHLVTDGSRISDPYPMVVFVARPELSSLTTARDIVEGSPDATMTLNGSGFLEGARVKVNGSSDGIKINQQNDTEIVAIVPASYFTEGGIYPVTVENPYPANVESNIQLLTVFFPKPAIDFVWPPVTPVRLEDSAGILNVDVFGYGFRRGAVVLFEGVALPTYHCELTPACVTEHLIAKVDPSFLRQPGFKRIEVRNPAPSLGSSQIFFMRVESLQPTITSVYPGSATVLDLPEPNNRYNMPVVVYGTNFGADAEVRVAQIDPPGIETAFFRPDEVISSTQLFFTLEVAYPGSIGRWVAQVKNPQPGGGLSDPTVFFIEQGSFVSNPFLISVFPETVLSGGPSFSVTVNGTNFSPGSQINFFSAPLVTTFVSSSQLTAVVPASLIKTPGKRPVTVTNPGNGGTSNKLFISVE